MEYTFKQYMWSTVPMKRLILPAICAVIAMSFGGGIAHAADSDIISGSTGSDFKKVGSGGAQFLKIGVGARAMGMAGAYSGVANDITSIYWNPAGINSIEGIEANFSNTQWFAGFGHNFVAGSIPLSDVYRAAVSVTTFSSGDIETTTMQDPDGNGTSYSISDLAIGLTFGGQLTEQFAFGATLKYVEQNFSSMASSGIVLDLGTMYATGFKGINLGFAISNFGSDFQYEGQDLVFQTNTIPGSFRQDDDLSLVANDYAAPLSFRAGLSADVLADPDDNGSGLSSSSEREHQLIVAGDFVTNADTPEQFAVGAEYTWKNLLSFRSGYRFGSDSFGLSGGIGLQYDGGGFKGNVNYAISNTENLGLINRLSVVINLD